MSFDVLSKRLAKLEEQASPTPSLSIYCVVVDEGREDEDVAAYFAERGIVPGPDMMRVRIGGEDPAT